MSLTQAQAPTGSPRLGVAATLLLAAAVLSPGQAVAQVAGQNINMVSGTKWPGGDPFLQRQNEPSLAVSSRNPLHLLAGANDYRTVDLPTEPGSIPGTLSGDAWLGVFKSFDGGLSWKSTLLPGYPQDKAPGSAGLNSPLKAYAAAADPTVRAGVAGLFFYSGIAFNRGTNIGAVFVSRFYDLNNKENGDATDPSQSKDPIAFVDTKIIDTGTSGQFIDKPWIAVDQPRGATTCTIPVGGGVTIPAGNVYMVWSRFTGSTSTKIMFSRSTDCGKSWSNPTKLSESNSINQGTNVAVDPQTGNVFVVWRRFATSSQPDAILCAKSTDFANTFPSKNTSTIANLGTGTAPNLWAFDQGSSGTQFRTNALPTMAISVDGAVSRIHVALAARPSATGDARIYVYTSTDGFSWTGPVAADSDPVNGITDDFGNKLTRGHQFMPQLTFSQGRLMLLYYDQRLDHTLGLAYPTRGFPDPATGKFYLFKRDKRGELVASPEKVYTFTISDANPPLSSRRHTIDLRVAGKRPSDAAFTATTVTQYKYGLRVDSLGNFVDETFAAAGTRMSAPPLSQLQSNPPNLPLFAQGTIPFIGDYIDIAGPAFVSDGAGRWTFNKAPADAPVFYATWTDNRDVVPPFDGNWTNYTPVGAGGQSVLDPTQTRPTCIAGKGGMRNQNVYVSRISDGLLVGSLQNIKKLDPSVKRAFVVTLQNLTGEDRSFRMTLSPGPGVTASFLLSGSPPCSPAPVPGPYLDVTIGARLGAARAVFATSPSVAGTVVVNVTEITGPCGAVVSPSPLQGFVVLNPEGSAAQLAQPDNAPSLSMGELYDPSFSLINISNINISNASPFINISNANENINISNGASGAINISNPDPAIINISNINISNTGYENINISNTSPNINISNTDPAFINISNPDPAVINISNPDPAIINISNSTTANINISNINISNTNQQDINISNQTVGNINISNQTVTDATYQVTNSGNTSHSYRVALYGSNPNNTELQLIATKTYASPTCSACDLVQQSQNVRFADVSNPVVTTSLSAAIDPNIAGSGLDNPTISLAPGESAFVTIRGATDVAGMKELVKRLTPVVTAHGANPTGGNPFAMLLFIQTTSGTLPAAVVGVPYSGTGYQFQSAGGSGTITWSFTGALPSGLTLSPGGLLSGTPAGAGTFDFSVTATDRSATPETSTQAIRMTVAARTTSTTVGFGANPAVTGQAVSVTVTVSDTQSGGTAQSPAGSVTLSGDPGLSATTCTLAPASGSASSCGVILTPASPGPRTITASYPGTPQEPIVHQASGGGGGLSVNKAATTAVFTSNASTSVFGQGVTFSATVTVSAPGAGTPTGTVTFLDGATTLGSGAISGGVATFSTSSLAVGSHSVTATYSGDENFSGSTSATASQTVNKAGATVAVSSPGPSTFGQGVSFTATVTATAPGAGTPTGSVTFSDGATLLGTVALASGSASFSTGSLGAGSHSISAAYSGDGNFLAGSGTLAQTVNLATTTAALASGANPSVYGQTVSFTATVGFTTSGVPAPTGSVTFRDGAAVLGTVALAGGGASVSTAALAAGSHTISASYSGDTNYAASTGSLVQAVSQASTTVGLVSGPNPSTYPQTVTLTATVLPVAPGSGSPSGTVTFFDGAAAIGTAALSGNAASLAIATLAPGSHVIAASYGGDASFLGSTSATVLQVVNVPPYAFTGFLSPLATAGSPTSPSYSGVQNYGSGTPIKYQLKDYLGNYVTSLASTSLIQAIAYTGGSCSGLATGSVLLLYNPTNGATGGSTFRYDTTNNQFMFNWDTTSAFGPGCYEVILTLNDGSPPKATTIRLQ